MCEIYISKGLTSYVDFYVTLQQTIASHPERCFPTSQKYNECLAAFRQLKNVGAQGDPRLF
jgi:hypothetical protein